jgi:hypothetical protein
VIQDLAGTEVDQQTVASTSKQVDIAGLFEQVKVFRKSFWSSRRYKGSGFRLHIEQRRGRATGGRAFQE